MADNSNTEQTSQISEPMRKGSDAPDSDNRPPTNPPRSTGTVECNMMEYTDDQGVTHQIYLPKGTMQRAARLFLAKNWEELGKFPAYGAFLFPISFPDPIRVQSLGMRARWKFD
ncbi:hypothetical protein V8F06_010330 [Rhypophila decipiens]